jgi:hypothetical protein
MRFFIFTDPNPFGNIRGFAGYGKAEPKKIRKKPWHIKRDKVLRETGETAIRNFSG